MRSRTIFILTLILSSCGGKAVEFEGPQPEGQSDEKSLPKRLMGQYLNAQDSSTLSITSEEIIKTVVADFAQHKSELDSADRVTFKADTSFAQTDANMKVDVIVKGDSIFQHLDYRDTIFSGKKGDILKKFKGSYFLNRETSNNNWHVTKLTKTKKGLILGIVSTKEDIEKLRELTEIKSDSIYTFRPTKRQLKRFLRDKGFSDENNYVKVK